MTRPNLTFSGVGRKWPICNCPNSFGFDLPGLFERVGGKQELAWALLGKFARAEAHTGQQVVSLIAQGDKEGARARLHDLKGVSANLSAVAISQACTVLRTALGQDEPTMVYEQELCDALDAGLQFINEQLACVDPVPISN